MKFNQNVQHMCMLKAKKFLLRGGSKFEIFDIQLDQHIFTTILSIVSKYERKRSKTLDFIAYFILRGFDYNVLSLCATSTSKWPQIVKAASYLEPCNFAKMCHMCIYQTKLKKLRGCVYLRHDSDEENITVKIWRNANLHHPGIGSKHLQNLLGLDCLARINEEVHQPFTNFFDL